MNKAQQLLNEMGAIEEDSLSELEGLLKKAKTFTAGRTIDHMERPNDVGVIASLSPGSSLADARKEAVEISKKSKYTLITNRPTKESDFDGGTNPDAKAKIKNGKMITLVYLERS